MIDEQQKLSYKKHARRKSTGDGEFTFSGACRTVHYESSDDHFSFSTELESQAETCVEERFGVYSPPLWKTNKWSKTTTYEYSPLLPYNHHYSNLSPNSRRRVITEGRRELMEMIQNLPESCYELSLKDIVDEQHGLPESEEENAAAKHESSDFDAPTKIREPKKKKRNIQRSQIKRMGSMESETFLIKMFFPTSLGTKKKAQVGNRNRVPSMKSTEQSVSDSEKIQKRKGFFVSRSKKICRSSTSGSTSSTNSSSGKGFFVSRSKKICRSSTSGSTSSTNSSSGSGSRYASESDFIPGCWSFFACKKSRSVRERECIFRAGN